MGTPKRLPISTARCMTPAPSFAISSISPYVICSIFLALGTTRGSDVYAVNVGIDFTNISMDGTGNGNGCRIGTAAAQRRDIAMARNALEASDDDDIALIQRFHDAARFQCQDTAFVKGIAGLDAGLSTGKGNSLLAGFLESHSHEGDGDLFARRQEHIHFTAVSLRGNLLC